MACGDFPYDCIADFAIDAALIALVVALGIWLLAALGDVWLNGRFGGAVKATISVAGASLIGGAATALMMCASREMAEFLKEVIDEQLVMAEEYNAVFMQMFDKNPDFYEWGRHEEKYEENCELGSVARARTPALLKTSMDAYKANKSRGRFQVGLGRRIFRDSAMAAGNLPAAMMATMANIEERMKFAIETDNWGRRTSILRTLGHLPNLSGNYNAAMKSYASLGDITAGLTGYLAKQTGAAIRLAIEPGQSATADTGTAFGTPDLLQQYPSPDAPPLLRQNSQNTLTGVTVDMNKLLDPSTPIESPVQ